ncbi:putative E3 ubiquitin-protein ligase RHY1A [Bidens hawaiensis]|uniref:putative E3 ubiquitin-protein ligase RHY1A n=1 Tax=Bidens hawaiensis TaxID=980011 RepID=UPI004048F6DB
MSKLFHTRRIRFTSRNDAVNDTHLDSTSPEFNSFRRATADRRHHHRNNRQGRAHRHHLPEHDDGVNQPQSGSIINSEDFRSIRRWGATENDRLPGVVLLARERLVERLRGAHISQNRENIRSSISNHQDEFSYNNLPMSSMTKMLPPGLSKQELNSLQMTVYKEGNDETSSASRECSICLEGFEDGDELINLVCMHRFHSSCLLPWTEVCGACPNCRKDIVVTSDKPGC